MNKETSIKITPLIEETVQVRIVGDTPLIVHAWSEKNKALLPAGKAAKSIMNGEKKANRTRVPKDYPGPVESFIDSLYWITEKPKEYTEEAFAEAVKNGAKFGVTAAAIKAAAISAAYSKKWIPNKKSVQGLFFIEPDYVIDDGSEKGTQLVEIKGSVPEIKEDIVRLSGIGKKSDLRWRPMFNNWYIDLRIKYDVDGIYSLEDIINMIHLGGHYNGICEWRPEVGGQYGMFSVQSDTGSAKKGRKAKK